MKNYMKIMAVLILILIIILLAIFIKSLNKKEETLSEIIEEITFSRENSGEDIVISGEYKISGEVENDISGEKEVEIEKTTIRESKKPLESEVINKTTIEKKSEKLTSDTPYYIKINNEQNVVNIYAKDSLGNYTIPYKAMLCSVGTATPKAGKSYKVTTYKKRWNGLQGNVYGQYATQIVGNILFHSVPYTAANNSSLEYWEYDKLGTAASLGCVRLTVADAKWIYDNISSGTIVEFYEDSDPGPFGKPSAMKISENEENRNWDPTDLAEGNPWNANPVFSSEVETAQNMDLNDLKPSGDDRTISMNIIKNDIK